MTSAFSPPTTFLPRLVVVAPVAAQQPQQQPRSVWESETEDEEVKRNCMFGVTPDSDDLMTTTSYNDSDDDEDDSDNEEVAQRQQEDRRCGVVHFMARLRPSPRILKPAASRRPTLSPPLELDEEDDEEDVVAAEVGARGVALALDSDDDVSEDDDSEMESVSGSDADAEESEMEDDEDDDDDDEEELDEEQEDEEEEQEPLLDTSLPQDISVTLERPPLEDVPAEDETASVILQALEEDEDDEEISSLIDSVQEQDEEPHLIVGVAQDRQDHANHPTVPRVKRVLSLDETLLSQQQQDAMGMLLQPQQDNEQDEQVVLKKRRKSEHDVTSTLESFTLGPSMTLLLAETAMPSEYAMTTPSRFLSPMISSSEELEEEEEEEDDELVNVLDGQLRYELESTASSGTGDQSPVPLLTPPESPVLGMTVCEWPSNLVVDSALTAAITTHIRPIDTAEWSEEEEATAKPTSLLLPSASSLLTPLMRGIQVGDAPLQGR